MDTPTATIENKLGNIGATVSATATARMKTYVVGTVNVAQQTRHARRIYVGGIPANFIDEDALRLYINSVVSQGLGEENDHSYVLSVYINHKKCFAFVELKSIELATACLSLDGIMMKNVALRILRANEYKPELVPAAMNRVIHFDLSGFQFGNPTTAGGLLHTDSDEGFTDRTFDSLIQANNFLNMEYGSAILVGYPYDESPKKAALRGAGSSAMPKTLRNLIRKFKFGAVDNAEYNSDMSKLRVLDIGDILGGKVVEEGRSNLNAVVSELLRRGGIPMLIGGSNDLVYPSWKSAFSLSKSPLSIISLGSKVENRIFDDLVQLTSSSDENPTDSKASEAGTYCLFGAQGSVLNAEEAKGFVAKGGRLFWLNKDLRKQSHAIEDQFQKLLDEISISNAHPDETTPQTTPAVIIHIDCGSLDSSLAAFSNNVNGTSGFKYDEIMQIAYLSGLHPSVTMIQITEFSPAAEETRQNMLVLEILYYFCVGYNLRIAGDMENFASPLGISILRGEDLKANNSVIESEYATQLTSMAPPSTGGFPPNNIEHVNLSLKLPEDSSSFATSINISNSAGMYSSAASTRSTAIPSYGFSPLASDLDSNPLVSPAGASLAAALQQQQQQQQSMGRYYNNNPNTNSGSGMNLRQQTMAQSASFRGLDPSPLSSSAMNPNHNSSFTGRNILDMKAASGQIPYFNNPHNSTSASAPAASESFYHLSSGSGSRSGMISATSSRGLSATASSSSIGAAVNTPSLSVNPTLSRSSSSRSIQASMSNNNIVFGNYNVPNTSGMQVGSRSNGASSFSGSSSHASSAHSLPSVLNSNSMHSLNPSPNASSISLLPQSNHPHYQMHVHSPRHGHVVRRGLYMQDSQIDFGQDPHPFDESTDLNFDMQVGTTISSSSNHIHGGNHHSIHHTSTSNSNSGGVMLGSSPGTYKLAMNASTGGGNEFVSLNSSTKSNSGIGFVSTSSASTDTTVVGGVSFPQMIPSSYVDAHSGYSAQQQQQQQQQMSLSSFYSNNNNANN